MKQHRPLTRSAHWASAHHRLALSLGLMVAALVCLGSGIRDAGAISFGVQQNLTGVWQSDASWGDFDNDGDLDLVICGESDTGRVTQVFENQSSTLVLHQDLEGIQGEGSGCLDWGDYDGDGDLDLAMAGTSDLGNIARIYENDGTGALTWDTAQVLTGVSGASVAWGDVDSDGDPDLVVIGHDGTQARSKLYRNDPLGQLAADAGTSLLGLCVGTADWADWDRDGDLDLLLTGSDGTNRQTIFYKNNPVGTLTNDGAHGLVAVALSDVAWGDFDNDGDLDLAFTGDGGGSGHQTKVYRNDGLGNFASVTLSSGHSVYRSSCAWGDWDNDGDLDVAFAGYDGTNFWTDIYENLGGNSFTRRDFIGLVTMREGSLSWADYDHDGDLDFFLTGADFMAKYARLFRSSGATANTAPSAPTVLTAIREGAGLHLTWSGAADTQTPAAGLYYCLRVGTSPGAGDVVSGTYGTPLMGNVDQAKSLLLDVPPGVYFWSVRAIDSGFMTSPWSPELSFGACPEIMSILDVGGDQGRQVRLQWLRAGYDAPGDTVVVTGYSVWRKVDGVHVSDGGGEAAALAAPPVRPFYPPGDWDYIATVPARGEMLYSYVAPTVCDSTAEGTCWSTFFVSAMTPDPLLYYDSDPDSGYSVDNLAPEAPVNLAAGAGAGRIILTWDANEEEDFDYYAVYRDTTQGFTPGVPIGYTTTPYYEDASLPGPDSYWYKVTAWDFSGNESDPSLPAGVATGVDEARGLGAATFALGPAMPSPFNPWTRITYTIPPGAGASPVLLVVYDAAGRLVRTLVDAPQAAGTYTVSWDGTDQQGRDVASGVYFYRLRWNEREENRRMVLAR